MPALNEAAAFRLAATLADDLIKERPTMDDRTAANLAWRVLKSWSPQRFHEEQYAGEVVRIMQELRGGRLDRAERKPAVWEKALEVVRNLDPPPRR